MAGLVPAIHVSPRAPKTWMPGPSPRRSGCGRAGGTSPGMTEERALRHNFTLGLWVAYCDSFTKSGNFSFPSAIAFGQTVTCFSFCHWNTRPVTKPGPDLMPWVNSSSLP
jgi:hypothetical protein